MNELEQRFPSISWFIQENGEIKIGYNGISRNPIAVACKEGSTICEYENFKTFDEALEELEQGIKTATARTIERKIDIQGKVVNELEQCFPYITWFIQENGKIKIGYNDNLRKSIAVAYEDLNIWDRVKLRIFRNPNAKTCEEICKYENFKTFDEALEELEQGIKEWAIENGLEIEK